MSRDPTTAAGTGAGAATGAAADYRALRDGAAAIDLSAWTALGLQGPDTRSFLHGVTTQDLEHLANGEAAPALVLTEKGRALALVWIGFVEGTAAPGAATSPAGAVSFAYVLAEEAARETLRSHFERFRVMENVEFTGPAGMPRLLGVAGPGRADLVSGIVSVIHGAVALRGDPLSFALVPADTPVISFPAFAGESAVEAWRLAVGIPRAGIDFDAERIATELALPQAISMTKGCYVGQEVVARTATRGHVRRHRVGFRFRWEGEPIARGTELRAGGRVAGHVTSTAAEPGTGEGLGMGFLSDEALATPVDVLAVVGARSTHVHILPWPL
jgi:folate-binding protein YgfZ